MKQILPTAFPVNPVVELSLEVPDAPLAESLLHKEFSAKRAQGEWFKLDSGDLQKIDAFIKQINYNQRRAGNCKPKTQKQLSTTISNKIASESGLLAVHHLPKVLIKLKVGHTVKVATKDMAVLRSVERKLGLRLYIEPFTNIDGSTITKISD